MYSLNFICVDYPVYLLSRREVMWLPQIWQEMCKSIKNPGVKNIAQLNFFAKYIIPYLTPYCGPPPRSPTVHGACAASHHIGISRDLALTTLRKMQFITFLEVVKIIGIQDHFLAFCNLPISQLSRVQTISLSFPLRSRFFLYAWRRHSSQLIVWRSQEFSRRVATQ